MFHHLGVVLFSGDALVVAVALLRHDGDEVQAVGLHLETGAVLVSVFPCVHGVVGVYGAREVKGHPWLDKVNIPRVHWWRWSSVPFGAVRQLFRWRKLIEGNEM